MIRKRGFFSATLLAYTKGTCRKQRVFGRKKEAKVLDAYKCRSTFNRTHGFIQHVRGHKGNEDDQGIDVVMVTDRGDIRIQIKSHLGDVEEFKELQRRGRYDTDIIVIDVFPEMYGSQIRDRLGPELLRAYENLPHSGD